MHYQIISSRLGPVAARCPCSNREKVLKRVLHNYLCRDKKAASCGSGTIVSYLTDEFLSLDVSLIMRMDLDSSMLQRNMNQSPESSFENFITKAMIDVCMLIVQLAHNI